VPISGGLRPIRIGRQDATEQTHEDWTDGLGGTVDPLVVGSSPTRGASSQNPQTKGVLRRAY
jgi:hypothetical protein